VSVSIGLGVSIAIHPKTPPRGRIGHGLARVVEIVERLEGMWQTAPAFHEKVG